MFIGSWNIHGWKDSKDVCNVDRIISSLHKTPCNIISFQECSNSNPTALFTIKKKLKYDFESIVEDEKNFKRRYVKLFTKYPFIIKDSQGYIESKDISPELSNRPKFQLNIINLKDIDCKLDINMAIICVHLNYQLEPIRLSQLKSIENLILNYCKNSFNKIPIILC